MSGQSPLTVDTAQQVILEPDDNARLANLCGTLDEHLRQVERYFGVELSNRGNHFQVTGAEAAATAAVRALRDLYKRTADEALTPAAVHMSLHEAGSEPALEAGESDEVLIKTRHGLVRGRGTHQKKYLRNIQTHDLSFGIGHIN